MSRIGSPGEMLDDMESGVWDFTENGECSSCGNCCSNFLPISKQEITRIKKCVTEHHIQEEIHRFPTVNPVVDMMCPFRDEIGKRCTIYEIRPAICRDFRCDKPRKKIVADRTLYQRELSVTDMRAEFFGRKSAILGVLEMLQNG